MSGISLLKKNAQLVLTKKNLTNVTARVGLVLDISGSMRSLYKNGTVQKVLERIVAVASSLDDDGVLDVWVYDHRFSRLPSVTENDVDNYVEKHILSNDYLPKFGRNDEPPVMRDVIAKYTKEEPSSDPAFVIFINDGGVKRGKGDNIDNAVIDSSGEPIFWQFIGVGESDFGVLKKLDNIEGRVVDNANFFQIQDIESMEDNQLYELLLNEFPSWLQEAKDKHIY
ncbi:vWA domain-containing protein [Paenibacillus polymyxa]|uniref:vWA domain-containing protein n=1 Tax=Paenibacillus polymyxa TaxID=1406 RepID=UPI00211D6DD8|nr:VWA domain-containing protein [Paenibacillus polymyxa]MDN4086423.1 VWA domain-containing protein [Paenibacillus polymyxa]MEE4577536.1 VWA domain-containing protein [Paenibacillus polymyxa]